MKPQDNDTDSARENSSPPRRGWLFFALFAVLAALAIVILLIWGGSKAAQRSRERAAQTASAEVLRVRTEAASLVRATFTAQSATQQAFAAQTRTAQPTPTATPSPTPQGAAGMALAGSPCLTYYDQQQKHLVFACLRGDTWVSDTVDNQDNTGLFSSLALDTSHVPHIAYFDQSSNVLKYAHAENDGWHIEVVDGESPTGMLPSLALDADGNPMISYYDKKSRYLKFARRIDGQWQIIPIEPIAGSKGVEGLDKGGIHYSSSLALDPWGNPAIAFYNHPQYSLKIARWQEGKFVVQPIDRESVSGRYCSLAFDPQGYPVISYYFYKDEWRSYRLKLERSTEKGFKSEYIGDTWESGRHTSLVLAQDGTAHIFYQNEYSYAVRHAAQQNGSWGFETLSAKGQPGGFPSADIDQRGNLFTAFMDTSSQHIRVIQVLPARQEWNVGNGAYPSLKVAE